MTDGKLTLRQTRSIIAAHPAGTFGARCAWPSRPSDNLIHALTITEPITSPPDVPRMTLTLFVFTNRRHNRLKVLYWDGSGLWVCAKRLERGRFTWPASDHGQINLRGEEFSALIHGLEVRPKAGWYRR